MNFVNIISHKYFFLKRFLSFRKWPKMYGHSRVAARDRNGMRSFFEASRTGNKERTILFASFIEQPYTLKIEGLISKTLEEKGWKCLCLHLPGHFVARKYHKSVFCNETVNINRFISWNRYDQIKKVVDHVINNGYSAIKAYKYAGSMVGIMSLASLSGVDASGRIILDELGRRKLARFMIRSCLYTEGYKNLLRKVQPNLVLAVEKGGVGTSEIFFQALNMGVDYVQWLNCHEPNSIMLKRYDVGNMRSHPFSVSEKSWAMIVKKPWNEMYRRTVMQEFEDGYSGNKWFNYKKLTEHTRMLSRTQVIERYHLEPNKKLAVIFSPILNDANLFYGEDLFKGGFSEWLTETIKAAGANEQVNWVLKLHPANNYRRANTGYRGEYGEIVAIREALGHIPENIKLIYPNDDINPLSLFQFLDYGLTVRGTVGAEIPCFGKRILTAGTGRYSGLGFTEDSKTSGEYLSKVRNIQQLPDLSEDQNRLALKHAYLFFKVRPAKYDTFAKDVYAYPQGHLFNRDIAFKGRHYSDFGDNFQLRAIVDWMTESEDEDYLNI